MITYCVTYCLMSCQIQRQSLKSCCNFSYWTNKTWQHCSHHRAQLANKNDKMKIKHTKSKPHTNQNERSKKERAKDDKPNPLSTKLKAKPVLLRILSRVVVFALLCVSSIVSRLVCIAEIKHKPHSARSLFGCIIIVRRAVFCYISYTSTTLTSGRNNINTKCI